MPVKRRRTSAGSARRRRMRQAAANGSPADRGVGVGGVIVVFLGVILVGAAILYIATQSGKTSDEEEYVEDGSMDVSDDLEESVRQELEEVLRDSDGFEERALKIAEKFLEESDPKERLKYVRNPEVVAGRIDEYHEETRTRSHTGFYKIGAYAEGMRSTAYAVSYENGSLRMLEVVETEEGLKVDWDSYARYSTVPWEELMSEEGRDEGVVRVFVQPGDYYNPPFDNPDEWKSFRITIPDIYRPIFGYAKADSDLANRIETLVNESDHQRQHMMLRIKRHSGPYDKQLFSVEELVTAGWVLPDGE